MIQRIFLISVCALFLIGIAGRSAWAQTTFRQFQETQQRAFNAFVERDSVDFARFKAAVAAKWRAFQDSNNKVWVTYSPRQDSRGRVDFEKGSIQVEAVVPAADPDALKKAQTEIAGHLRELITVPEGDNRIVVGADSTQSTTAPASFSATLPVLRGMLFDNTGLEIAAVSAEDFSRRTAEQAEVETERIKGEDGVERLVVRVEVPMVPDHLRIRAERYLPHAREYSRKFGLDIAMVMAVMHTESYFNPQAKSPAPAYGLMQIVPGAGGRDGMRFARGLDKAPSPSQLYRPRENVEIGSAYLKKIRSEEFKGIEDSQKGLYCAIAAYNCGPSNVARTLSGSADFAAAAAEANAMTSEMLYQTLRDKLPSQESRDYIARVTDLTSLYVEWR